VGGVGIDALDGCGIGGVPAAVCPLGTVVFGGTGGRVPLDGGGVVEVPAGGGGGVLDDPVPDGGVVEVPAGGVLDDPGGGALEFEAVKRLSRFRSCTFRASMRCCLSGALLACAVKI